MAPAPDAWFEDVTSRTGINFACQDGSASGFYQLLESVGGGSALFDYDRDGDIDVFLIGGGGFSGPPAQVHGAQCALFRNDGDLQFVDVTIEAGLGDGSLFSHGCSVGDFDRDGWPDLFVAGFGGVRLYRNSRTGGFVDATESTGVLCPGWNVTGAWADCDNDGWLDLYVVTYADWAPDKARECRNDQDLRDICGPTLFRGIMDRLWRNRGDGTFEEISSTAGLVPENRGLGVVAADFNNDTWIDFYVVNDVEENQLYVGGPNLKFESSGVVSGVAYSASGQREGSMGVDAGDFDGDGLIDLWWANYAHQDNSLARNIGGGSFLNVSDQTGLLGVSRRWVGFGTGFADFDSDGWLDLFVLNGHVAYERLDGPYFQPAQLFQNVGGQRFREVNDLGGPYFGSFQAGRGAAVGDLDDDGAPDLVLVHQSDPVVVLRNRRPPDSYLRVQLQGTTSNLDAVGAQVTLTSGETDRKLVRVVRGGGGYLSHFDSRILFPLADDSPASVSVRWPDGSTEEFRNLKPNQTHVLVQRAAESE